MNKLVNSLEFLRQHGFSRFAKECYYRASDSYFEKRFNVNTAGKVSKEALRVSDRDAVQYSTIAYLHTLGVLNRLPVAKQESTLLDYGCGKGRAIVAAASTGFARILGVERSDLVDIAKRNISRMKHRRTERVELEQCDAQEYELPKEVNVVYFYNPFIGSVLENVTRNIRVSYQNAPRKIHIVYFNNDHFDRVIAGQSWLTKISQSEFHRDISCGIYATCHPRSVHL